jgi:general secretion pathway protein H
MRTSAVGNNLLHRLKTQGFTLLELLLVLAITALASAGVALAMRDSAHGRLESEAQRLAASLESARAHSRALGVPVRWRTVPTGFVWDGLPSNIQKSIPQGWSQPGVATDPEQSLLLGPEPIITPQSVRIWLAEQPQNSVRVVSDGLRPFALQSAPP